MNAQHRQELCDVARQYVSDEDPSHDFLHAFRILKLSEKIAAQEGGDLDVITPAALFHDAVIYPKNDPRSASASAESARLAAGVLEGIGWYPKEKIEAVTKVIERCSFSKNLPKDSLEEHIVQDADLLESLGAISIARTFCSTGQMRRQFYDLHDPKGAERTLDPKKFALDLFPARLLKAKERLHTAAAKAIAERRESFLHAFYDEFLSDIDGQ